MNSVFPVNALRKLIHTCHIYTRIYCSTLIVSENVTTMLRTKEQMGKSAVLFALEGLFHDLRGTSN